MDSHNAYLDREMGLPLHLLLNGPCYLQELNQEGMRSFQ